MTFPVFRYQIRPAEDGKFNVATWVSSGIGIDEMSYTKTVDSEEEARKQAYEQASARGFDHPERVP